MGSRHTNDRPSRTGFPPRAADVAGNNFVLSIISKEPITKRYELAFNANSHAMPSGPISTAANAGPKMREPVITVVFNDIAFGISDGSTSSVTKPRRDGLSMALAIPVPNDKR